MASVSPMGVSAAMARRRRAAAPAQVESAAVAAIGAGLQSASKSADAKSHIESNQNHHPVPYAGFGQVPPLVIRPLMMIDPSTYHHLRRYPVRLGPVRLG